MQKPKCTVNKKFQSEENKLHNFMFQHYLLYSMSIFPIILIIKKSEAVGLVLVVFEALDHWTVDTLRP